MAHNIFYWVGKTPVDNAWRPQPGQNPTKYFDRLPNAFHRMDLAAMVVDCAPFIAGAGGVAHLSQAMHFGFTAHASIFRNAKTLTAIHRTALVLAPLIFLCQASGFEYRRFIPRWAHERELRRDEEEVRKHVDVGMAIGGGLWTARLLFRLGARYWAPVDVIMGGALADLLQREYLRAHSF
ncbi:hypothetical protein TI39_contig519g00004 [Zymoseptoria brevis]|uniref:Uncharacterized protein n=1 Tax=Zymoseptoria brevis TaxID=1047168 RepID=A0A0F4GJ10_9PEZI|nr:hypothetical protein TI39_contig519g00004 [Zymoseptoria brevis]